MEFGIKEMQVKEVDPFYNIRIPLFNIPTAILAWMEVFACEKFLQPYGGHAIYDAFIPITQITYIFVLFHYTKKAKKVDWNIIVLEIVILLVDYKLFLK